MTSTKKLRHQACLISWEKVVINLVIQPEKLTEIFKSLQNGMVGYFTHKIFCI